MKVSNRNIFGLVSLSGTSLFSSVVLLIALATLAISCEDIIEEDINDGEVFLIAPGDSLNTKKETLTFLWEPVEGASNYIFQLVSGSFERPEVLFLDTLLTDTKFTYQLDSGSYNWGVSAQNAYYATNFSVRKLTIESKENGNELYDKFFPEENMVLSDTAVAFVWNKREEVEKYIFEILESNPPISIVRFDNFYTRSFERNDSTYKWQITTVLKTGESDKSPIFNFSIDVE